MSLTAVQTRRSLMMNSPWITAEEAPQTHWSPSTWLPLWSLCMWPSQSSQGPSGENVPAAAPRSPHSPASLQIGPKEVSLIWPVGWNKPQTVFFFWCLCIWGGKWVGAIKRSYCNMEESCFGIRQAQVRILFQLCSFLHWSRCVSPSRDQGFR